MGQSIEQAIVVPQAALRQGVAVTQLALFKSDGTVHVVPSRAAAQTDVGAVTSVVAAGAAPTKAEYDALRVDALATRTVLNSLLAKLRTANVIAP
jgi:hypothetical protein